MTMILKYVTHDKATNSIEAAWANNKGEQIKCTSYADVQMDMLESDLGADAAQYADLVAQVRANIKPAPTQSPAAARERNLEKIQAEHDRRRFHGGVKVGGKWFKSDPTAVQEYLTLSEIGNGAPLTTVLRPGWRTMTPGVTEDMTLELVRAIMRSGIAVAAAIYDTAQMHKAALEQSQDPANYDFSTGWPPAFWDEHPEVQ